MNRYVTRFTCSNCKRKVALLQSAKTRVLEVVCEQCETKMEREGFAFVEQDDSEVSPLFESGRTRELRTL